MGTLYTVCRVGELQDGEAGTLCVNNKTIALFRDGGQYFAIDNMCPHMGAELSGGFVADGIVTCPWHYWRFRLADGAWADNPRVKIGSYPVYIVGDEIQIEVPDSTE
jgi:nitrite reductase (NADH) small subunit/3-phenylpropionate/trans-cinnamate dioxygenase ferredoxin subunit